MISDSSFKVLFDMAIGIVIIYGILKVFALTLFAFMACSIFKLAQTKRGFLFIGILGGALSFLITVLLGFIGINTWDLYKMAFIDMLCVFSIVYFVRK